MVDFSQQQLNNRPVRNGKATYWEVIRGVSVGLLFVGLILAYSWNHMEILSLHYQMEELEHENSRLKENNAALRAEYNSLTDPQKISRRARDLGLISANQPEVTLIHAGDPLSSARNLVATAQRP